MISSFQGTNGVPNVKRDVYDRLRGSLRAGLVTKPDIISLLCENGLQRHRKHVHYIHFALTGTPRNDISKHEDRLVEDITKLTNERP